MDVKPPVRVPEGDKRFADPAWRQNPAFFAVRQGYLAASQLVSDLLAAGAGDLAGDARARLATGFLLDALARHQRPARPEGLVRGGRLAGPDPGAWRASATTHRGSWREDRTTWPGPGQANAKSRLPWAAGGTRPSRMPRAGPPDRQHRRYTMGDMKGQVAVVTGGTRGIGLAISERLLNRGVTVAAGYATNHDHAREFADKYADRGVSIHQGNVGHNEDVLRVFGEVLDRHGHVDILVNNAGLTLDKTVRKMDPREWDHVIHVNLSGAFYASRAVLQHMLDRGYGRIINISSIIGSAGGFGQANYAAAKSGMFGLTMSLALETAGKGITVNTVTPGFIGTDMTAAVPADALAKVVARIPAAARRTGRGRPGGGVPGRPRIGLHHRPGLRRQRRLVHVGTGEPRTVRAKDGRAPRAGRA